MGDDLPRSVNTVMDRPSVHLLQIDRQGFGDGLSQGGIFGVIITSRCQHSTAIFLSHVDASIEQVAQAPRELLVVRHDEALLAKVAVIAGGDVTHDIIAQTIGGEGVGEHVGVDHIAKAFADLRPLHVPPSVNDQTWDLIIAETKRVKHDGPVDGVRRNENVLADHVRFRGPKIGEVGQAFIAALPGQIAGEADVIG